MLKYKNYNIHSKSIEYYDEFSQCVQIILLTNYLWIDFNKEKTKCNKKNMSRKLQVLMNCDKITLYLRMKNR